MTITPTQPGITTLFVYGIDRAGHYSPQTSYDYFVSYPNPALA